VLLDLCGKCILCGDSSNLISGNLGVCLKCIRKQPKEAVRITEKVHAESRGRFGLPPKPLKDADGVACGMCMNDCRIGLGKRGFCGLMYNIEGRLVRFGGTPEKGILEWYYDPLPTNCVAWWFCAGCTGSGYPKYAYKNGPETGYSNLAVFYGACSYDCLFCQNWHYRSFATQLKPVVSAESLASQVTDTVSCICYFGGDPSPQMPHAIRASEIALEKAKSDKRILRICWETNGYMKWIFAERASRLSLESGGTVKFDLKTWDENLSIALCGVSNKPSLENFKKIGEKFFRERLDPPMLTASTLLVPGYVDIDEVRQLASFIASVDRRIPYTLLAFYPQYIMDDLLTTTRKLAYDCLDAAKQSGLEKVRIGNVHLLTG